MTAAAPWSVKGIDPKAREVAKELARRSGMTLGEWLNRVILEDEHAGGGHLRGAFQRAPVPGRGRAAEVVHAESPIVEWRDQTSWGGSRSRWTA